jgi:hypothetical protein
MVPRQFDRFVKDFGNQAERGGMLFRVVRNPGKPSPGPA